MSSVAPATAASGVEPSVTHFISGADGQEAPIGYVLANVSSYTVYGSPRIPEAAAAGLRRPVPAGLVPLTGHQSAAKGVTLDAKLGCGTRAGGTMQATYNGYPLYTSAVTAPPA